MAFSMAFITERDFVVLDVANAVLGVAVLLLWMFLTMIVGRGLLASHRHRSRRSRHTA